MMGIDVASEKQAESTKAREAFFLQFASRIRLEFPDTPLMVTGGFRTRKGMQAALDAGDCELIGIGRPAALDPALPLTKILNTHLADEEATLYSRKPQSSKAVEALGLKSLMGVLGAGAETVGLSASCHGVHSADRDSGLVFEEDSGSGQAVMSSCGAFESKCCKVERARIFTACPGGSTMSPYSKIEVLPRSRSYG